MTTPSFPDAGGAAEQLTVSQALPVTLADAAGAADGLSVVKGGVPVTPQVLPRCAYGSFSGGSGTGFGVATTGWVNCGAGVAGTAPQPGDLVIIVGNAFGASKTITQTGDLGNPWTILGSDNNGGATGHTSLLAIRQWTGQESAPSFGWSGAVRWSYSVIAVDAVAAGAAVSVDVAAAVKKDAATGTSTHSPPAASGSNPGDLSLVLVTPVTTTAGTFPVTYADGGWTIPAASAVSNTGGAGTFGCGSAIGYSTGAFGTITPDAWTMQGGGSTTGNTFANLYHLLLTAPAQAVQYAPAARVFVASAMPQMHLQNLVTGQWLHRDVRGITSPSVTWVLNGPDTFTCTIAPPRPDMLDPTGNPVAQEWQTACYLEQGGRIKFGGILTASQFAGPQWTMNFTGFLGYPAGMIYEGGNYTQSGVDSLDVVRYLWSWLQSQPGSNLGVNVDRLKSGVQLGVNPSGGATGSTTLTNGVNSGARQLPVHDPTGFAVGGLIVIDGSNNQHTITKISKAVLSITPALINGRAKNTTVWNLGKPARYTLRWWNSTDIGAEIGNIATETPFDQYETHEWGDPLKQTVVHRVRFGVPRIGTRRTDLRFAEGENITEPVGVSRDGSAYASDVVGLGAGQGSAQIRAQSAQLDARLRRMYVYTDQTVFTQSRMQARTQRVLAARRQIDTPASVVLRDHPNARFGSFAPGDDILIQQATGWRQTATWVRITQMQQDPTTQAMTLTCARSDSFTYQGTI